MIKYKYLNNPITFLLAFILTGGFVWIYGKIFSTENRWEILVWITLPLIIGSVLLGKYKFESLLFLISSITMVIGFLFMFSSDLGMVVWWGIIQMNIGAYMFSYGILRLWLKATDDLIEMINNKEYR